MRWSFDAFATNLTETVVRNPPKPILTDRTGAIHAITWQSQLRHMMVEAFAQIDKEEIDPNLSITVCAVYVPLNWDISEL